MKWNIPVVALATLSLVGAAIAQSSAPASRAEVKAETRAATKTGTPTAAGEGAPAINPEGVRPTPAAKAGGTFKERRAAARAKKRASDAATGASAPANK